MAIRFAMMRSFRAVASARLNRTASPISMTLSQVEADVGILSGPGGGGGLGIWRGFGGCVALPLRGHFTVEPSEADQ